MEQQPMTDQTTTSIQPDGPMADAAPPSDPPIGFLGIAGLIASAPTPDILRMLDVLAEEDNIEQMIEFGECDVHPLGERLRDWYVVAFEELRRRAAGRAPCQSSRILRREPWADFENAIERRLDLVAFIADHGGLRVEDFRPVADIVVGPCPFGDHQVATPPLIVDPAGQRWVCTECGRGGDVFDFVLERYDLRRRELVAFVARAVGLDDGVLPEFS